MFSKSNAVECLECGMLYITTDAIHMAICPIRLRDKFEHPAYGIEPRFGHLSIKINDIIKVFEERLNNLENNLENHKEEACSFCGNYPIPNTDKGYHLCCRKCMHKYFPKETPQVGQVWEAKNGGRYFILGDCRTYVNHKFNENDYVISAFLIPIPEKDWKLIFVSFLSDGSYWATRENSQFDLVKRIS